MEDKLFNASMRFIRVCDKKLTEKERQGYIGWDDKKYKCRFEDRLKHDIFCELTQNRLVNISNFCMFLWNLMEIKKGVLEDENRQ